MTVSMDNLPAAEDGFAVTREMIGQWRAAYDAGELPDGYAFDGPIKPGRPKLANEATSETDPTVSYVRRNDLEPFDLGSVGAGDTVEALAVHKSGKVEAVRVCGRSLGRSERHGGLWWDLMAPEMLKILEEMSAKRVRALKTVIGRFDPETGLLEASQRELAGLCDTSRTPTEASRQRKRMVRRPCEPCRERCRIGGARGGEAPFGTRGRRVPSEYKKGASP